VIHENINIKFSSVLIAGWVVALTCYISHSAKHRKMADFDPRGGKPLNLF